MSWLAGSNAPVRSKQSRESYYVHADRQTYGPFTPDEIHQLISKGQVLANDLVCREHAKDWLQAKDDSNLQTLFHGGPRPLGRRQTSVSRRRIALSLVLPVLLAFAWVAWPYYAVYKLFSAFRESDIAALESRIEWDSVRQGLKSDINALVLQNLSNTRTSQGGEEPGSALGMGLAAVLAPAFVNRLVDGYVTPQAITASTPKDGNGTSAANLDQSQDNFMQGVQSARKISLSQVEYIFFSDDPFTFKVQVRPEHNPPLKSPVTIILKWSGSWRLTRIFLPLSEAEYSNASPLASSAKEQSNEASHQVSETTMKTSSVTSTQESLLEISLVNKGFKVHNYQSSDYEDDITFNLRIKNVGAKDIRAFDGFLTFTDLLDNKILSSKLAINDPVRAGATMEWVGAIKYNQFMEGHQRLRSESQANLKVRFSPGKILFADGNTKSYQNSGN